MTKKFLSTQWKFYNPRCARESGIERWGERKEKERGGNGGEGEGEEN